MALPQESRGLLERAGAQVLYTGVGKVNAALTLARKLAEIRCSGAPLPLVVNMGTAGSRSIRAHSLVAATHFTQRDMDVSGLGFAPGVTPFDATPAVIEFPLARVCLAENARFGCMKYVTDGADSDSATHWEAALDNAARAFAAAYESLRELNERAP